jgi:hypothetical protein
MFRGNKISVKNFDKLIEVWSQKNPTNYALDLIGVTARVAEEKRLEREKMKGKGKPVFSGRGPNAK